jgi:hypothetical protein
MCYQWQNSGIEYYTVVGLPSDSIFTLYTYISTYYTRQKAEKKQGHQREAMESAPQVPQLLKQMYKIIYNGGIALKLYVFTPNT